MGKFIQIMVLVIFAISCLLIEASARHTSGGRAVCSQIQCRKYCEFGFMVDDNNCTICACKPNPNAIDCPAIECPKWCPSYQTDANGCTTCECKSNVSIHASSMLSKSQNCSLAMCLMYCEYGFRSDDNGCPICSCQTKEEACRSRGICRMHCENGFKKDEKGCDICECQSAPISSSSSSRRSSSHGSSSRKSKSHSSGISRHKCGEKPMCMMNCPNGFKKDENGCDTCECSEAPAVQSSRILESSSSGGRRHQGQSGSKAETQTRCSRRKCSRRCPHGYVQDSFGCNTCACSSRRNRPSSSLCPACANYCPHGRKRNNDGCESCTCNDPPAKQCATCSMYCPHGFKEKADGCYECVCKDPPAAPAAKTPCISCFMFCEHGFKKGSDGCDLCECSNVPQ